MKSVFTLFALLLFTASMTFAEPAKLGPDELIAKLYKEHKDGKGLFFQTKSRAPIDRYFMKDLADLIWKDALASKGEVGAIEFDPLFGSQDPEITQFKIIKSGWAADAKFTDADKASVEVTFKNQGKKQSVRYAFDQDPSKNWKIYDVRYPDGLSLREIFAAQR
jgi:hypothetical protein